MAWEIINEPSIGLTGTFTPQADQSQYVSTFGVVGGTRQPGWVDGRSLEQGVPSQDGRGRLGFARFVGDGKKENRISFNGMELAEYVAPRKDADRKAAHDAGISNAKTDSYMRTSARPATETEIGRAVLESTAGYAANVPSS